MMNSTINIKDAAVIAGMSVREMRELSFKINLEPRPKAASIADRKVDRDLLFEWLVGNGDDVYRLREAEAELQYSKWLADNGEFLKRFLAENA